MKTSKTLELQFVHCVHCGEEMSIGLDIADKYVPVCSNPACPNYGLVQVGIEKMPVEIQKERKNATANQR